MTRIEVVQLSIHTDRRGFLVSEKNNPTPVARISSAYGKGGSGWACYLFKGPLDWREPAPKDCAEASIETPAWYRLCREPEGWDRIAVTTMVLAAALRQLVAAGCHIRLLGRPNSYGNRPTFYIDGSTDINAVAAQIAGGTYYA